MPPKGNAPPVNPNGNTHQGISGAVNRRWTPWLVPVLVVAHVAAFVITMYFNDCPSDLFRSGDCVGTALHRFSFQPVRENPLFGPSAKTLVKLGGLLRYNVVYKNEAWRLFTCIYLHAGIIHLVANMISLLFIGIRLEQQFGFIRIGIIYVLSGFGGSVLSALLTVSSASVGASSCLFGLLAAMLSELLTNWTIYSNKAAALVTLLAVVIINLVVGIVPFVDNFGHIGGFVTGFLLGFVLLLQPQLGWVERHDASAASRVNSKYKAYQLMLLVAGLLVLAGGLGVALYILFDKRDVKKGCSWCHYISCVPTSKWTCNEI